MATFIFNSDQIETDDFDHMTLEDIYANLRMVLVDLPEDPYDLVVIMGDDANDYGSVSDYTIEPEDIFEFKKAPEL